MSDQEEAHAKALFDASPAPLLLTELGSGRIAKANVAACNLFEFDAHELLGRTTTDLGLWLSLADRDRARQQLLAMGSARDQQARVRTKSGKTLDVLFTSNILDWGGAPHLLTSYADISDRLRAEEHLRVSHSLLTASLESTADGLLAVSLEGKVSGYNGRFLELWGIPASLAEAGDDERLLQFVVGQLTAPEAFMSRVQELMRDPVAISWDEVTFRDGRVFERYSRPQRLGEQPVGRMWSFRDVTERRRAERALRESEQKYRELFDGMNDGAWVLDFDMSILDVNAAAAALLGYSREELRSMTVFDIDASLRREQIERLVRTLPLEKVQVFETQHRTRDGRSVPVEISSSLVTYLGRQAILSIARDLSDRRRAAEAMQRLESEMLRAQKLESIGTLAAGIAHDFNNLLQCVLGGVSLAKLECEHLPKALEGLEEAERALEMSMRLSNQLLTFAKGGKPAVKSIDLRPVVVSSASFALSGSSSTCQVTAAPDLRNVDADEGQLGQVIQNLVLNGAQAMVDGGRIVLEAVNVRAPGPEAPRDLADGDYVMLTVADAGVGIPPENLSRIFDPYFSTKATGSGLGLATCYSIVSNHRGKITVDSTPGKGTTFRIFLPASSAAPVARTTAAPHGPVAAKQARILLMDDDDQVRGVAGKMLVRLGHEATLVVHGEAAIASFVEARDSERPFDLVILDLVIKGGMGGEETAERLREIDPAVKLMLSSGYADSGAMAAPGAHGFAGSLSKPYTMKILRESLDALLG